MCSRLLNLSETELSLDKSLLTDATSQTKFVAVVGPARTGKSYLLNYSAGKLGVFPVGNAGVVTSNVDIMNGAVQLGHHRVRLIDVEGFGDNSENYYYRLCVPVMAASDAVLLNIRGKLGRTDLLTLLGRFIFMHNMIHKDQIDCELNKENKASLFPALILVMRDWQGTLSGEKYLTDLMRAEPEDNADQKERNGLRKSVGRCFESIRIVTMPQPADVSALNDEHIPFDRTTEEFRAQAEALSNIVQDALSRPIRTLFGNKLGTEVSMAAILTTLATEVSKPHFSVPSTMQALHKCAMREVDRMLDNFMQEADPLPKLPCESEQLKYLLKKRTAAMSKKYAQLTANLAKDKAHKKSFMQTVKESHDEWTVKNDGKLARICQSACDKVEMALRSAHSADILTWHGRGMARLQDETLRMFAAEGVSLHGNALPTCWLEYCNRIQRLEIDSVGNYCQIQQLKQQLEEINRQAAEKPKQMEHKRKERKRLCSPISLPCPSPINAYGLFGLGFKGGTGRFFWQRKKIEEKRKRMERKKEAEWKRMERIVFKHCQRNVFPDPSTVQVNDRSKSLSPWGDPCVGEDAKGHPSILFQIVFLGLIWDILRETISCILRVLACIAYWVFLRMIQVWGILRETISCILRVLASSTRNEVCNGMEWEQGCMERECDVVYRSPRYCSQSNASPDHSTGGSTSRDNGRSQSPHSSDPIVGYSPRGHAIHKGPRNGFYHVSPAGTKIYHKKDF